MQATRMASSLLRVTQQVQRNMSDIFMGALLSCYVCVVCAVPIEVSRVPWKLELGCHELPSWCWKTNQGLLED